jgi:hypothetical protein
MSCAGIAVAPFLRLLLDLSISSGDIPEKLSMDFQASNNPPRYARTWLDDFITPID